MHELNRTARLWLILVLVVCCGWLPRVAAAAAGPQATPSPTEEAAEQEARDPLDADAPATDDEAESDVDAQPDAEAELDAEGEAMQEADAEAERGERESPRRRARHRVDKDTQIHLMSDLRIDEGEVARDALVVLGELHIDGKVQGDAVAILGPVFIEGEVTGAVTAIGDDVHLGPESEVFGDVISVGGRVELEPGARVHGEISEIDVGPALEASDLPWGWDYDGPRFWGAAPLGLAWGVFWTVFRWVLLILVTSFVFLVARGAVQETARVVSHEPWKAGLLGLATWLLFFPLMVVATIVLVLSIIGIPLLIVVWPLGLFALLIACLVGYTATAYSVGGWLGRRFGWASTGAYGSLLLGVVAIQAMSLVAELFGHLGGFMWFFAFMFGLTGWVIRFAAWTAGLGATIMAFAERRRSSRRPPAGPPPAGAAPRAGQVTAPPALSPDAGSTPAGPPPAGPSAAPPDVGPPEG